jgi:hypothetical protein
LHTLAAHYNSIANQLFEGAAHLWNPQSSAMMQLFDTLTFDSKDETSQMLLPLG